MPVPSRPYPTVGAQARIAHFGGGFETVTIVDVDDDGRRVEVCDESGQLLQFALNPASARFLVPGVSHGPRLELLG